MARKAFNPYAKGIPEKKTFPSRYDSIRDTTVSGGPNPAGQRAGGVEHGQARHGSVVASAGPSSAAAVKGQPSANQGTHASTRVPGAGQRTGTPPVDRDLLDGLEGNHRRQRGWEEDSQPNEVVDGISITPISRDELQKKLAAQKSGGFLGGKNL